MRYIVFFICALLAASSFSSVVSAECLKSPDCVSLGYNKTSCPAGSDILRCPFDITKLSCQSRANCEGIGKKTCGEICVNADGCCQDSDCGTGKFCKADIHKCSSLAKVGDIYYSDGTFSANLISGKTPIGVVGYIKRGGASGGVIALDSEYDDVAGKEITWGCYGQSLSLGLFPSHSVAIGDYQGFDNNYTILAECSDRPIAASYCDEYSKAGERGWYLPAYGELNELIYTNYAQVNQALSKVSGAHQIGSEKCYWSSSLATNDSANYKISNKNSYSSRRKNGTAFVRCVLAF